MSSPPPTNSAPGILDLAGQFADVSGPVMLVIALIALWRGWVVFPREVETRDKRIVDLLAERDEFKELTLKAIRATERAVIQAEERR